MPTSRPLVRTLVVGALLALAAGSLTQAVPAAQATPAPPAAHSAPATNSERSAPDTSAAPAADPAGSGAPLRQVEHLDRAPEAALAADGVHVSWRMLGTDPDAQSFLVYRDGTLITASPLTRTTDLVDPSGGPGSSYVVYGSRGGAYAPVTRSFGVRTRPYVPVHLDRPAGGTTPTGEGYTYSANDTSVGDADGDGQYEFFVKWDPSDSKDNSIPGYTGPTLIDAYRMDGTRLWRIDVGRNIRAGAHYTPFQVYDYDGDGRAEIALKTADGTVDGAGVVIGDAHADHRSADGYIKSGAEFLTIFSGLTGRAIDTVPYEPVRGVLGSTWGDTHASKADRYLAATAYLDGVHPSLVMTRGYYYRTALIAYDFDGRHLTRRWLFDSSTPGNAAAASQGNHQLAVADVDGDGRDEIVYGSMTVDDDGRLLYSTGLGHGDALTVADLDPSRPGYEAFAVHEFMERSGNRAATFRDARTGQVLWSIPGDHDTGRGLAADVDPRYPGAEAWSYGGGPNGSPDAEMRTAHGTLLGHQIPQPNFAAFWDGDPLREMVDVSRYDAARHAGVPIISKWNWLTQHRDELMTAPGSSTDNGTKGDPMLQADLLGDWREELVWRSDDSSEMRIYSTTIPTDMRLRTLMQDPMYRVGVAWQNSGYNQSPQPSYFIGAGMGTPPAPRIRVVGLRAASSAG